MGGRLLDWLGQGLAADRPLAVDVPTLVPANSAVFYYAKDTQILSVFDENLLDWLDIDAAALAAIAFATLPDVDFSTPPTDGQVFAWDLGASKLVPYSIPAIPTTEQTQDLVGAMGVNGTGTVFSYDDVGGFFTFDCTVTQYTDELAQDAIGAAFAAGTHTGITVTYNDGSNKYDLAVTITQYTDELAQDAIGAAIAAGTHVGITITYTDGSNLFSFTINEATSSDMWTGTSSAKVVTPKKIFDAAAPVSVAYGATVTLDLNTGINFDIGTLTGPVTLANFTNAKPGQSGIIHFVQDGTGGRVITYGANFVCAGGLTANGLLSTGASLIDEMTYFVRTDGKIVISVLKDVKA